MTLRHASFFTGVGGVDLGYERAGMVTVSQCEFDPYASAVLAERYPGVPNLGDITKVVPNDIPEAEVWSGGFPCQDLSNAGKRAGFAAGTRSSLAFTFIDLLASRKPRWVMLENVAGLFSSNGGADFARLLSEMANCGYRSISWRVFDARHFGVAQRRRRVFIVGSLSPDGAQQVLFECEGGHGHIAASSQARQNSATGTAGSAEVTVAGALQARFGKGVNSTVDEPLIISTAPDADRMRSANGLAKGLHDSAQLEAEEKPDTVRVGNFELYDMPNESVAPSMNAKRARDQLAYGVGVNNSEKVLSFPSRFGSQANVTEDIAQPFAHNAGAPAVFRHSNDLSLGASYDGLNQKLDPDGVHRTLRVGRDSSDFVVAPDGIGNDEMLPEGLDGHRYRCCGNGVVAPVAEWIGRRIVAVDAATDWGK